VRLRFTKYSLGLLNRKEFGNGENAMSGRLCPSERGQLGMTLPGRA